MQFKASWVEQVSSMKSPYEAFVTKLSSEESYLCGLYFVVDIAEAGVIGKSLFADEFSRKNPI